MGEFVTLNGQCIIYKNGKISTKTGFDSPQHVNVLGEELFYDDDFNSFTVYCISSPLIGVYNHRNLDYPQKYDNEYHVKQQQQTNHNNSNHKKKKQREQHILIEYQTDKHWIKLLASSLPPNIYKKILEECQIFTTQFKKSYIMLKGYTQSASKRIEDFRKNLFDHIFNTFLVRHYRSEDNIFEQNLSDLRKLSQSDIGIKKQFQSKTNFESAVNELSSFNKYKTPINRLGVLKNTFKIIRDCIDEEKQNDMSPKSQSVTKDEMALTTEDFIALFSFVLIHCKAMKNVLANNEYIKYFYFKNAANSHLDYFQASFEASISFIRNQLFTRKHSKNNNSVF